MSNKTDRKRRMLLQGAAIGTVAAGAPLTAGAAVQPVLDKLQRGEFPTPDFDSFLGESVSLKGADGLRHRATIAEVENLSYECSMHRRPSFVKDCATVVRLEVADVEAFDDQVYQMSHPQLGKHPVMFSVVPDKKGDLALEAVFN